MKQKVFFIATIIVLLASCQQGTRKPGTTTADSLRAALLHQPDSTALSPEEQLRWMEHQKAELDYYLERHNVQDEGYEMVARYAAQIDSAGTTLNVQETLTAMDDATGTPAVGRWRSVARNGVTMERDRQGRMVLGLYSADTLFVGIRIDSLGIYTGELVDGEACGHGSYRLATGEYYEGHWQHDERDGFGFSIAPGEHLRAGQWKVGKYLGERMHYTSERIYGIDVSRYQHGKGRKKHGIAWNNIRIRHLGKLSQKKISGEVDYPVDFVFLKSTEGVSVRNPFYATDYQQARRQGIRTGAYHFFSPRIGGAAQAQYFLHNTYFTQGDLPPVLDVEPSASQIAKMGGPEALFTQIRAWLQAVERHIGAKPILYVNQTFVNRYLPEAPDVKHDYQVWIARYGEYKPDVKLVIWQLSPDGRVNGIQGDVDINVFNGYRPQWEEFLETKTLQKTIATPKPAKSKKATTKKRSAKSTRRQPARKRRR